MWENLWKSKYAPQTPQEELIRAEEDSLGSVIWSNAWKNQGLVQKNNLLGDP
jgi:hypothetical protein